MTKHRFPPWCWNSLGGPPSPGSACGLLALSLALKTFSFSSCFPSPS